MHLPIDHQPSNIYYSKISTHLYQGNISYKDFLSDFVVFHRQWEATPSGNWTRRLIPHIETWVKRTHGELDYFLTQLMSGHGNYAAYLHRFGIMDSGECAICQVEETPEHKFFECKATENHRRKLEKTAGRATPENLVAILTRSPEHWGEVARWAKTVLGEGITPAAPRTLTKAQLEAIPANGEI